MAVVVAWRRVGCWSARGGLGPWSTNHQPHLTEMRWALPIDVNLDDKSNLVCHELLLSCGTITHVRLGVSLYCFIFFAFHPFQSSCSTTWLQLKMMVGFAARGRVFFNSSVTLKRKEIEKEPCRAYIRPTTSSFAIFYFNIQKVSQSPDCGSSRLVDAKVTIIAFPFSCRISLPVFILNFQTFLLFFGRS